MTMHKCGYCVKLATSSIFDQYWAQNSRRHMYYMCDNCKKHHIDLIKSRELQSNKYQEYTIQNDFEVSSLNFYS